MAYTIVLTACPNKESAETLAKLLVTEHLAACVQRMPVESTYIWNGEAVNGSEIVLFIKTRADLFERISARIRAHHEYELPEIIQIPITNGLSGYLRWVDDCTS
ncbi:MAG: divalent-cation tolerance protein CutA [Oscillospiraceae bacterium]|nr:divalent-cation tolerance protein CutA [Oscillospiraceae bacterium]